MTLVHLTTDFRVNLINLPLKKRLLELSFDQSTFSMKEKISDQIVGSLTNIKKKNTVGISTSKVIHVMLLTLIYYFGYFGIKIKQRQGGIRLDTITIRTISIDSYLISKNAIPRLCAAQ